MKAGGLLRKVHRESKRVDVDLAGLMAAFAALCSEWPDGGSEAVVRLPLERAATSEGGAP